MSAFKKHIDESRKLALLRLLKDVGGEANDSVLKDGLGRLGFSQLTRDQVRADIRFLIDNGLVVDEWFEAVQVCKITRRGVDFLVGAIEIDGIKSPSMGV